MKKNLGESPQLVWYLAMTFLQHFGTAFTSPPSPVYDGREQCNLYAKMTLKMPAYKKSSPGPTQALLGGRKTRDFLNNKVDQYVKFSDFFINEHHRRIFKRTFPKIYAWVFELSYPLIFSRPKCNWRLALRCDDSRVTSPEARVRGSELSRKRSRDAQCGTLGPSVRPF